MERTINMTENEKSIEFMTLDAAEGSIEAGQEQQKRLEEFTERVGRGEFHDGIDQPFPCTCIDGRPGGKMRGPNTAGGSLSLLVADDLTTKNYQLAGSDLLDAHKNMINQLRDQSLPVGGHRDTHAHDQLSGCGAADKMANAYEFMVRNSDVTRSTAEALGVNVSDDLHELLIASAAARTDFSSGRSLVGEFEDDEAPVLAGDHKEVIATINTIDSTTLNREKLSTEFGPDYQAFNVDAWALKDAAKQISENDIEAEAKFTAMIYFNLAIAYALTGKKMRAVVL